MIHVLDSTTGEVVGSFSDSERMTADREVLAVQAETRRPHHLSTFIPLRANAVNDQPIVIGGLIERIRPYLPQPPR